MARSTKLLTEENLSKILQDELNISVSCKLSDRWPKRKQILDPYR